MLAQQTVVMQIFVNFYFQVGLSITSGSTIELENQGEGHLLISSEMIATGTYVYSLIVDNKLIDAKKFILSK